MHQPTDPRYTGRSSGGVDDALQELDREMRELQQKMDALRHPAQPDRPPAPPVQPPEPQRAPAPVVQPPAPPAPRAPERSRQSDWIDATGGDLRRLRDNLNRLASEMNAVVEDLLTGVEAMRRHAPPQQEPQQRHQEHQEVRQPPQPQYAPPAYDVPGSIELDVGPFDDLVSVERFKQALGDLPGVEDVYVKAYGKSRATIELTVDDRQTVVDEMHVHLPYQLDAGPAPDGKVVVHLHEAPAVEQPGV